jgi:hypothetical protein
MGQSASFLMHLKSLPGLCLLILVAVCFSGCETTATTESKAVLGPNEARVVGHKTPLAYSVLVAPASRRQEADWKNELIIPAGTNRLAVRYKTVNLGTGGAIGGAIAGASEEYNMVEIEFEALAGHEYNAEMWGMTIFNMGFKITDKATGAVVGQAKVKDQKKSEKAAAKSGS